MKRGIIILVLMISMISLISAEVILTQPLNSVYNLGDRVEIPITISSLVDVSGTLRINLICNGTLLNLLTWNGLSLEKGYSQTIPYSFKLVRNSISESKGTCNIQAIFGTDSANIKVSDDFKISDRLEISGDLGKIEFDAGEGISITGKVVRETGENSGGFVEAKVLTNDENNQISQIGIITDGVFNINLSLPGDLKAGNYFVEMKAYEKDSDGIITNNGASQYNIHVNQVPTNLELVFEGREIMPGTSLKVNAVLHDQTGEPIDSTAFITVKNSEDKIIEQGEIGTEKSFELLVKPNQPPEEWTVYASSNELTAEGKCKIKENYEVDIQIMNKTVKVTNIGNVFYNKTILVKVSDSPLNIQVALDVGESKKYVINAPDGDYNVRISEGTKEISEVMSLTGKAIGIKEASEFSFGVFFWFFLILVLGFVAYFFFKKLYKKPFFGKMILGERKDRFKPMAIGEDFKMVPKKGSKAELSLSIKEGEKQDASVICLKIKDLKEMHSRKSRVSETIQKIIEMADDNKAVVYENQDYLFFIFAPTRTRTLKNEKSALDLAEKIKYLLEEHNRMFNQKIEFGISLNYGAIVGKQEGELFKFMSMGSLVTASKRIAYLSEGEILLSDKINDLLRLHTRTEKSVRDGVSVFSIKEIKKETDEATKKFINRFMERQKKRD